MIQVNLTEIAYNYLLSSSFLSSNWKTLISIAHRQVGNFHILTISEDQSDEIRDICGEQLQLKGFDEEYNPTPEGEILESLVDKFFINK